MNIKLIGIKKIYTESGQKKVALDDINLDINEGDYISFVGPSGAGKTTLLSVIAGLIKPTSGDIYFDNQKLTKLSDFYWSQIRRKYFGLIFQKRIVIPYLNVLENVILPLIFLEKSISYAEAVEKANEILSEFDLLDRKNVFPSSLSGGEIQRLTIARALINEPKILIADEPTGDLDIQTSKKIMEIFKKFNKEKKITIIIVTHNPELAKSAKTVYSINQGKITELIKG